MVGKAEPGYLLKRLKSPIPGISCFSKIRTGISWCFSVCKSSPGPSCEVNRTPLLEPLPPLRKPHQRKQSLPLSRRRIDFKENWGGWIRTIDTGSKGPCLTAWRHPSVGVNSVSRWCKITSLVPNFHNFGQKRYTCIRGLLLLTKSNIATLITEYIDFN